ncbi:MAG: ABC transporter ATP-binding protein [Pseudomonadota bacterium]
MSHSSANPQLNPLADPQDAAIIIEGLQKTYAGGTHAVRDVSLTVARGSIFGLLGPNGAGKSTIINILAGTVKKSAGQVIIDGYDIDRHGLLARQRIGIVPQETNFDPFFSPFETLETQAGYFGVRKADRRTQELLEVMGLGDKVHANTRDLSGGMRRRLMVAKALVHDPPILVLDEPTAGVDVELRNKLWAYVSELRNKGVTIILTTHYLYESEKLCDTLAIVNKGTIIALDQKDALLARLGTKKITVQLRESITDLPEGLAEIGGAIDDEGQVVVTYGREGEGQIETVLAKIQSAGLAITDIKTSQTSLEDIFVELTGEQ